MEWISIEDKLPEPHKAVLVTDGNEITIGYFREKDTTELIWDHIDRQQYTIHIFLTKITYWMPLPQLPLKIPKFKYRMFNIQHNAWYPAPLEILFNDEKQAERYAKENGYIEFELEEISEVYQKAFMKHLFGDK